VSYNPSSFPDDSTLIWLFLLELGGRTSLLQMVKCGKDIDESWVQLSMPKCGYAKRPYGPI
jgi:hypothetical protein